MSRPEHPVTMAVRVLREHAVPFVPHLYRYTGGGAKASAVALGVSADRVAKTLVFEDQDKQPLTIVMNGPWEVAPKLLARQIGCKRVGPCAVPRAEALTGYKVGGTSPFGQRTEMPVYIQLDLFDHATILVNGGQRGFLIEIAPDAIVDVLGAELVDAAAKPAT